MDYITFVKPEDQLKVVASGLGYYAADLKADDLFLRAFVTTTDGQTVESGSVHLKLEDVLKDCPTLAANAAAIVAELTAVALKLGLCPLVPPEVTAAFQQAQVDQAPKA